MLDWILSRQPIADPIDTDDHAYALPDLGVIGALHIGEVKKEVGKEDNQGTPDDVVDGGEFEGFHSLTIS